MVLRRIIHLVLLPVLFGAAACATYEEPESPKTLVLANLVGSPPTAVQVQVENLPTDQRIDRVFLVDRRGRVMQASEFETSPQSGAGRRERHPSYTFGVGANSPLIVGLPRGSIWGPEERGTAAAIIPLTDREAYLADPDAWTVIVEGVQPSGALLRYRVAAPRPPTAGYETPATGVVHPLTPTP